MDRVGLYARVSTRDRQDLENQLRPLREWARARNLEAVEHVDRASGRRDRRPGLDALLGAVRRGELGGLAVVRLDRLARSTRHLCNLAAELEALDARLVVLDQSIDTSTPVGRFTFHVLGAVGELELEITRERVLAGLETARRKGRRLGRPPALDRRGRARARRLRASGHSLTATAQLLGVGKATVFRALAGGPRAAR